MRRVGGLKQNLASVNVDDDGILIASTPLVHSIYQTEVAIPF
jgi:hypothetical protein